MIVFKTFLKVLNKNKVMVIIYSALLIFFGVFNTSSLDNTSNFVASKPNIIIVNNDEVIGLTKNLIEYLSNNTNVLEIKSELIDDTLFYREASLVIYIPSNFRDELLNKKTPIIDVKSTNEYKSSLAEMILKKYVRIALNVSTEFDNEDEIIKNINDILSEKTDVVITSKLDTNSLARINTYFSFANYTLLAGAIYVVCMILSSFRNEFIYKRTVISSYNYNKLNLELILSNSLFVFLLWLIYIILSFVLFGSIMFENNGLLYIFNSFVFVICALSIAYLISSIFTSKGALNGIINVVALGSSFLCGAFVPTSWLPDYVIKIAHIMPSYYYIDNNALIENMESANSNTIKPFINNLIIILVFTIVYIVISIIILRKKRKIA